MFSLFYVAKGVKENEFYLLSEDEIINYLEGHSQKVIIDFIAKLNFEKGSSISKSVKTVVIQAVNASDNFDLFDGVPIKRIKLSENAQNNIEKDCVFDLTIDNTLASPSSEQAEATTSTSNILQSKFNGLQINNSVLP